MKLYTFFRSSAAYRVRIALRLKSVEHEEAFVHFRRNGGEHRQAEFLERNPQGLLPVLEVDGDAMSQSLAIIDYLDTAFPNPRLIPENAVPRARVLAMAQAIACDVHPLNNLRVLIYLKKELGVAEEAVNDWVRHWVSLGFEALETQAKQFGDGEHLFGEAITLADVCLVPQVYNARRFGTDLSPFPTLVAIDAHLNAMPEFHTAAPEVQPDAE